MATCPKCGVSTREEPGAMVVEEVFEAKPLEAAASAAQLRPGDGGELQGVAGQRERVQVFGRVDQGQFLARAEDVAAALGREPR